MSGLDDLAFVNTQPCWRAWVRLSINKLEVRLWPKAAVLVNATYLALIWELIDRTPDGKIPPNVRRTMRVRSLATLCLFGVAAVVALRYPLAGLGICICCLIGYLSPEPPWAPQRDGAEQK